MALQVLQYTHPNRLPKLHGELLAAGLVPLVVGATGDAITLKFDPPVNAATVEAVVTAHDPSTPSASEAAEAQAVQDLTDLKAGIQTAYSLVNGSGWDGLTANQRRTIMLLILQGLRALGRRVVVGGPQ